jgi:hypothetical protein
MSSENLTAISEKDKEAGVFKKSDKVKQSPIKRLRNNKLIYDTNTEPSSDAETVITDNSLTLSEMSKETGTVRKANRAKQVSGRKLKSDKLRFDTNTELSSDKDIIADRIDNNKRIEMSCETKVAKLEESVDRILDALQEFKVSRENRDPREIIPSGDENARKTEPNATRASNDIRLPRGGWIVSPFEDTKFTGKQDAINPMRFLHKFEGIAKYEAINEPEQLYFFGKCLMDQASVWFELQDFDNINEAKEKFTTYYWGATG